MCDEGDTMTVREEMRDADYWSDLRTAAEFIIPEDAAEYQTALDIINRGEEQARWHEDEEAAELSLKMAMDLIYEFVPYTGIEQVVVTPWGRPLYFCFRYQDEKARADHEQLLMDELERRLD